MPELGEWALTLAGSPWLLLILYAVATIDGFFPPAPSESVVIVLAALSASGGEPNLWLLGAVAATGAFTGAVGFVRGRFSSFAGVAAMAWSAYSIALGAGAGHLLAEHHPLVGVGVGVAGGLLTGVLVDYAFQRLPRVRRRAA